VVAQTVSGNVAPVQIRALESTWVQATDPFGKVLFSGLVNAGETAGVDAQPPMRIRIGNAKGTELRWRGQVVDIASSTRGNTATVDLR
jgi:cytoskeleton protein RodZ